MFIAAGYQAEEHDGVESAQKIALEDIEKQIIEADFPEPIKEIEPKAGSFEKLMNMFR